MSPNWCKRGHLEILRKAEMVSRRIPFQYTVILGSSLLIVFCCNFCNKSYSRPPLPFCGVVRMWARGAITPPAHVICTSQFNRFCSAFIYKSSLFCPISCQCTPFFKVADNPAKFLLAWHVLGTCLPTTGKAAQSIWQANVKQLTHAWHLLDNCLVMLVKHF